MKSVSTRTFVLFTVVVFILAFGVFANAQDKPSKKDKDAPTENNDAYEDEGRQIGMDYEEDEGSAVLDREDILKVINRKKTSIRGCYEKILQTNQSLKGKLMVNFTIQLNGSVKDASIVKGKSSMKDKKVTKCVMGIVKNMIFPKRKKGEPMEINFPFNFQPKK